MKVKKGELTAAVSGVASSKRGVVEWQARANTRLQLKDHAGHIDGPDAFEPLLALMNYERGGCNERLHGHAIAGDNVLFTDEDAVMAAGAVVEPVLIAHGSALPYLSASWAPAEADAMIAAEVGWHHPIA